MRHNVEITLFERFVASSSYLTLGLIGMIWFIVNTIVIKKAMSKYLILNIIQSFIISIIFAIIGYAYEIFAGILINLPYIGKLFGMFHIFLVANPVYYTLSLINFMVLIFLLYLCIISFLGKLPFIPFITDIAKKIVP